VRNRPLSAWLFSFLPLVIAVVVFPMLPDQIPGHFDLFGNVTRYGSKYEIFVLPIISILMGFFWILMVKIAHKDKEKGAQNVKVLFWADISMTFIFIVIMIWVIYTSYTQAENVYNSGVDFGKILAICISITYIILGNYLPKSKQNWFVGIRTHWTLTDEETWYKTHRLAGKVFLIFGVLSTVLCLFVLDGDRALFLPIGGILVLTIPIVIYSYRVYKSKMQKS